MGTLVRRTAAALGDVVAFIFEPWRLPLQIRAAVGLPVAVVALAVSRVLIPGVAPLVAFFVPVVFTRVVEVVWLRRQSEDDSCVLEESV
jgi:hypothetical protein